jgi:hypothetical protein
MGGVLDTPTEVIKGGVLETPTEVETIMDHKKTILWIGVLGVAVLLISLGTKQKK